MAIAPLTLSDLGDDVGIDQVIRQFDLPPEVTIAAEIDVSRGAETSSAFRTRGLASPEVLATVSEFQILGPGRRAPSRHRG